MSDKPKCKCGRPAKFRGDRVGDHGMGSLYYPKCAGHRCLDDCPDCDGTGVARPGERVGPSVQCVRCMGSGMSGNQ